MNNLDPNAIKIAIIGPGALGCLLSASLKAHNFDVTLLDYNKKRVTFLNEKGITIIKDNQQFCIKVPICLSKDLTFSPDWVIFLVKNYDTLKAINTIKDFVKENTKVLSLQNGLGHERLFLDIVSKEKIALGTTAKGANSLEWGCIRDAGDGDTFIGPYFTKDEVFLKDLNVLAHIFNESGWHTFVEQDIKKRIFQKLLVNVGINALSAILCIPNGKIIELKDAKDLQQSLVKEALEVIKKHGVDIGLNLKEAISLVEQVCKKTAQNKSSMLQDRLKRKKTEIDAINGAIVRLGEELKIPTPFNTALLHLIKAMEASNWGMF